MKKKYLTKTYLRGVSQYQIHIQKVEQAQCYYCVKHITKMDPPYIETHMGLNTCLLDNGYHILEYLPLQENYAVRIFFNDKKEIQQYYIDITKENSFDHSSPYYLDLFLDITIDIPANNQISVWDQDELLTALQEKDITQQDFDLANKVCDNILAKIKAGDPLLPEDPLTILNKMG